MTASSPMPAVDAAVAEVEKLRRLLGKNKQAQVRSKDELLAIKATAHAWFQSHEPALKKADETTLKVMESAGDKHASRKRCMSDLKELKQALIALRTASLSQPVKATSDSPPDFTRLVSDPAMRKILVDRWTECIRCLAAQAPLAATVMMGGLIEGLLLARINREPNKAQIFKAKEAPRDRTGNAKQLREWVLKDFISVAHELRWITVSAKDVGHVLRDYRNYIHPQKQLSGNVSLMPDDASLLWEMSKGVMRQLLR
jgi:hypothetical protein